jgi:hypothetical protein
MPGVEYGPQNPELCSRVHAGNQRQRSTEIRHVIERLADSDLPDRLHQQPFGYCPSNDNAANANQVNLAQRFL